MKRYVGYSEYFHDAAIAIVNEDGTIPWASQSERYSGIKNDPLIPPEMWNFVKEDDHVTFYEDIDMRREQMGGYRTHGAWSMHGFSEKAEAVTPMRSALTFDNFNTHHESHCAGAFLTRPWKSKEDTVMVSVDGSGELESMVIKDHNFKTIKRITWPQSLGCLYGLVVRSSGMRPLRDEYIIMGLACYGQVDEYLYYLH